MAEAGENLEVATIKNALESLMSQDMKQFKYLEMAPGSISTPVAVGFPVWLWHMFRLCALARGRALGAFQVHRCLRP